MEIFPHSLFCNNQIKGRCITHDLSDVFYYDDDRPSIKGSQMITKLILKKVDEAEKNIIYSNNLDR